MSVTISDDLYARLLSSLGDEEVRNDLIRAGQVSNTVKSVMIEVPETMAAHFAGTFNVGATTAMMCSGHEKSVAALRDAAEKAETLIPEAFASFLHGSDVEKVMDGLIFQNGEMVISDGYRQADLILRIAGKRDFSPMFKKFAKLPKDEAQRIADDLNAWAERCRPMDDAEPDTDLNI